MTPTQSDEDSIITLKACPFCNGIPHAMVNLLSGPAYWSKCSECGVESRAFKSPKELIEYWNTRYAEQELEAVKREYWMAARRAKDGTTIGMDYTEGHGPAFSTLETYEQFKQAQGGE